MATIEAVLTVRVDGQLVRGYPLRRRQTVTVAQSFVAQSVDTVDRALVCAVQEDGFDFLAVRARTGPVRLRPDGISSSAAINLEEGGFALWLGAQMAEQCFLQALRNDGAVDLVIGGPSAVISTQG